MISGSRSRSRPKKLTIGFPNRDVVDAGFAPSHQTVFSELPQLVAIAAVPNAGSVVPFVLEADSDSIVGECPEVLHKPVVEFTIPFAGQKSAN